MNDYTFDSDPIANPKAIVQGANYRFTILTDRLVRYEWSENGQFEDRASTFVIRRNLPVPEFRVSDVNGSLEIETSHFIVSYDKKRFSATGLVASYENVRGGNDGHWRYGEVPSGNLGGTIRTLDGVDGRTDLGTGIMTRDAFANIDDSKSVLFDQNNFFAPRKEGDRIDGYLFAYGRQYREALKAFHAISGKCPRIPRWALGNWWSRYYKYEQTEYLNLMDKFAEKKIPLSVAVIDMDWHLVDDKRVTHSGWTGYTWNKELFPNPEEFRDEIHKRNLKITLNDHPHSGVHAFEDGYEDMAKALGHDTSKKAPIKFDAADPKFLNAFFNVLHRGLEKLGCDFWWIDWQQGVYSAMPGLDPLWALNHFQYLDAKKNGNEPIVLSRYAGPGSHRYPVGFSGDSFITWDSLAFQSELTATASNIGYGWWSHDIGGHMFGRKEDELLVRWVQLGIFSPIVRLHSTDSLWNSKEPWLYPGETEQVLTRYLNFRHVLVPYIFTESLLASEESLPLIQPMYYEYPDIQAAYEVPNQFFFGSTLLIAPIVTRRDVKTRLANVKVWLPPAARYADILTGTVYDGGRFITMYRPLGRLPVLASEGSIITVDGNSTPVNGCENPEEFQVIVAIGADAHADIIEKHGSADKTIASFDYSQKDGKLTGHVTGRKWLFTLISVTEMSPDFKVTINEKDVTKETTVNTSYSASRIKISIPGVDPSKESTVVIELGKNAQLSVSNPKPIIQQLLHSFEIEYPVKDIIWNEVKNAKNVSIAASAVLSHGLDETIVNPVLELLLADSRYSI